MLRSRNPFIHALVARWIPGSRFASPGMTLADGASHASALDHVGLSRDPRPALYSPRRPGRAAAPARPGRIRRQWKPSIAQRDPRPRQLHRIRADHRTDGGDAGNVRAGGDLGAPADGRALDLAAPASARYVRRAQYAAIP